MTISDQRTDLTSKLRPRNWNLPLKLLAVVLVPTLLALALGGLRILDQVRAADALSQSQQYVTLQESVGKLAGQLQRERDRSAVFVAEGRRGDVAVVQNEFVATDTAWSEVQRLAGDPAALPETVAGAYRAAEEGIGKLPALRAQVTSPAPVAAGEFVKQYNAIISPVLLLQATLSRQMQTPGATELAAGIGALGPIQEQLAQQHALIAAGIAAGGRLAPGDIDAVRAADVRLAVAVDEFKAELTPQQQATYGAFLTSAAYTQFDQAKQAALGRAAANQPLGLAGPEWDIAYDQVRGEIGNANAGMGAEFASISSAAQDQADNMAGISAVVLLLAILLGATIVVLISGTLTKPLRTLRRTALDVAERRLPQAVQSMRSGEVPDITIRPVPVTSREEIGQVARAFDAVHSQAVRLAAEQATLQANVSSMFVNLSRRSQGLVERQLQLIEQLERNEQDPDQLSNLFQLDHLATRMRRNSENLLVLAGSDLARRGGNPVPIVDVLRAAVSEVEQYQRIVVQPPPPVRVLGRAATDLVHLLAELLDNATIYSAPDTQVVMSSSRAEDGAVLIEVSDRGVGMSADDLAEANGRLTGPPSVDVSASRRMGLFVIGRLGSRHGIGVHLASAAGVGPGSGVTASVSVPSHLVTRGEAGTPDAAGEPDGQVGTDGADRPVAVPPHGQHTMANGAIGAASLAGVVAGGDGPAPPAALAGRAGPSGASTGVPSHGVANGHTPGRPDLGPPLPGSPSGAPGGGPPATAPAGPGPSSHRPSGGSDGQPPGDPRDGSLFGAPQPGPGTGAPLDAPQSGPPAGAHAAAAPTIGMPLDSFGSGAPATDAPAAPDGSRSPDGARGPRVPDGPRASGAHALDGPRATDGPRPPDAPPVSDRQFGAGAPARSEATVEPAALGAPPQPPKDRDSLPVPEPPPPPAEHALASAEPAVQDRHSPATQSPAQAWPSVGQPGAPANQGPVVPGGPLPEGGSGGFGGGLIPPAPPPGPPLPADAAVKGTTPIFEEIASAWFREKRPVPVDWEAEQAGAQRPAEPAEPAKQAEQPKQAEPKQAEPKQAAPPKQAAQPKQAKSPPKLAKPPPKQAKPPKQPATPSGSPESAAASSTTTAAGRPPAIPAWVKRPTPPPTAPVPPAEPAQPASEQPRPERPAVEQPAAERLAPERATPSAAPAAPAEPSAPAARTAPSAPPAEQATPPSAPPEPARPAAQPAASGASADESKATAAEPAAAPSAAQSGGAQPDTSDKPAAEQPAPDAEPKSPAALSAYARPEPQQPAAPSEPPSDPTPPVRIQTNQPVKPPEPKWPERPHQPAGFGPVSREFASTADAGWEAAKAVAESTDDSAAEELTAAGLPKRKPRARLIPGSAAPSSAAASTGPSRTAEQVRGRLARYQAGIRQGREDRLRRPYNPAVSHSGGQPPETHDEEHR